MAQIMRRATATGETRYDVRTRIGGSSRHPNVPPQEEARVSRCLSRKTTSEPYSRPSRPHIKRADL